MAQSDTGRMVKSILVIEDDIELCSLMSDFFTPLGIRVEASHDGRHGLESALAGGHDLVILDAMLPVLDGFELLRQLRKRSLVPVLMLTARASQPDRVAGLDAGADDYLPKPFGPEELLARMRAIWRRTSKPDPAAGQCLEAGSLKLNPQRRTVHDGLRLVDVTSIEFDILEVLIRTPGRVVSRDELTAVLYQRKATPYERSLDVHISHLRRKLENNGACLIQTVRGVGYLFALGSD
jgi:two-component system, OmpR family, response regulator CpxR